MKALVLCGGIPQAALIKELKSRGIYTLLADMNPNVIARQYADEFFPISVLDYEAVKKLAVDEKVDMVLTACADQVLLVQAHVSEELSLPCYISYETAKNVSNKELMKQHFINNGIPTSKYFVMEQLDEEKIKELRYPLVVKPVDAYSSRGVRKVFNICELRDAFIDALEISRTRTAIIEEFVAGEEITIDVYVEDGMAHVLCISSIDKLPDNDKFIICRTRYPAQISDAVKEKIATISNQIAEAFGLKNSPMLVQMITDGDNVSVVEFCARTGGGDKFRLIKQASNFDVIKAVVDLTMGQKPHVVPYQLSKHIINEFLYVKPGIFDHIENFEEMKKQGIIDEYFQLKPKGFNCLNVNSSSARIAYYTIITSTIDDARKIDRIVSDKIKIIDNRGEDILRHDYICSF
ncbi:ATP-grasp domain-containing protein [Selenomonas sp. AE3005]|uniref:ATP-grasp domain-containing protein n=1 Tax=Selenomonas sp. AE3005 TaxID=1485543 RepID=UPI0025F75F75|nr:ATP-grasp domain-containing protein [Selenomonas sp. AE3005]